MSKIRTHLSYGGPLCRVCINKTMIAWFVDLSAPFNSLTRIVIKFSTVLFS